MPVHSLLAETSQFFSKSRTKELGLTGNREVSFVEKQATLLVVQLSKDSIIAASLTILGTFGLADMTMRRVAASLGVAPGALYWHFKNKQALIDATARTLLADFLTSRYDDFPTACRALRNAMLATRDGAELISAALIDPTLRAEVTKVLSVAVPESGAVTALHFVMGATVLEQSEYLRLETTESGNQQSNSSGVSDPILGLENARQAARIQADNQFQEGLGIITRGLNENQR